MKNDVNHSLVKNFIIGILLVFSLIVGFLWSSSGKETPKKAEARDRVVEIETQIKRIKKEDNEYTIDKVTNQLMEDSIDLNAVISEVKQNLLSGFDLAYNHTKNETDFKVLETKLPELFGSELSNKVISLAEPVVSQSGQPQVPFEKIDDETIGFGSYDNLTHSIGILVIVNYQSPTLINSNTRVAGEDLYELNYDVKNKIINLKNYSRVMKGAENKND